ncbi:MULTISPECIES: 23S rRNA (guanosine(2251)-2'-O)-methyltransferase RlmB [Thiorhodovibrio]|uniref:23S rRNA (guanosine(2251)-2'-O)-methyltransferase RlmB n=1 Tax=Thiorhodovibrio TaxID=61593 RepID=UPI001F5D16E5|nr:MULTISPECIES: 23S rRNA (guanosine(2251)-2'-O)-methyltransferase RlmB [Thiorhodovibrio]WPL14304.1 23S rRNA (guanosine-2'-O-)-methyltransferase RlmB [Thiorhodovibrio litoralis]
MAKGNGNAKAGGRGKADGAGKACVSNADGLVKSAGAAVVIGINAVRAALNQGGVRELWLDRARRDRRLNELVEQARADGVPVRRQARDALDDAASGGNHQGALAWTDAPVARTEADLDQLLAAGPRDPLLLVLDGVTDPHNLGACLRCADGAGALAVIAPRDRAVGLNATAVKVASGAAASVPFVQVTNLSRTLTQLQERGVWVLGLAGQASHSLFELELKGPLALVLGSEGKGMRRLTREHCDQLAALPMRGQVESLNVSVSAGICLYEAVRQRLAVAA